MANPNPNQGANLNPATGTTANLGAQVNIQIRDTVTAQYDQKFASVRALKGHITRA